jgi:hypothetical protein
MRYSPGVALVAILLVATSALAQPITCQPDAEQPLTGRGFYFSADTPRWQEIVPSREFVCEVSVVLRIDQLAGDLLLRVHDDSGATLGQATIEESKLALGTGEYAFDLDTAVTQGELHRLVLSSTEPDVFPAAYFWLGDENSLYDDGISDVHLAGLFGYDFAFVVTSATLTAAPAHQASTFLIVHDARPNPFNPSTTIVFEVMAASHIRLAIFNLAGRWVTTLLDRNCLVGRHQVFWNGRDSRRRPMAAGVYVYRIEAGSSVETRRVVIVR